ncbi:hypothetical protein [Acidipropionibacterium jensenii]|uniref:hypothetical protein n=1 Tax=Acidipropionibacterium jensenii TaxID=1749 RepID=UPI00040CE11C|nr:hypothetical protein [Acidipropionibacterium jensenii]MDN5978337.1 hypothetical protein [Acidipropionibacterium jensenii]MDN5995188.1 hypothetical protein [Acidipropionibacterium jensenii]MDN6427748.1 hypothetical protein [Acidipropionibacterium jensenii]MDN6442516.1 hypothetical protein [Acidipropionibacterium jensenii]MDN6481274.1 hypothetical protein [Acidipropionibacterium jensenii]
MAAPTSGWAITQANVGLRRLGLNCTSLPAYRGPSTVLAGTTISGRLISTGLDLSSGSITIERSCIRPTKAAPGMPIVGTTNYNSMRPAAGRVIIRDSEIDGTLLDARTAAQATGFIGVADLARNYIHRLGSGIGIMNAGSELDSVIEQNYVTGLVAEGDPAKDGTHSDAFTVRDFDVSKRADRTLVVRNNRFDCDSGSDTGALFIQTYSGRIGNVLVEGNLLEGGGYQLGLNGANYPYSNVRALNNRFSGTGWGPAYLQGGKGWTRWENNHLHGDGDVRAQGAAVNHP